MSGKRAATTCPLTARDIDEAKRLRAEGHWMVVVADPAHPPWRAENGNGLLEGALRIAELGPVLSCRPREKRPATAHGHHDATQDTDLIRSWWRKHPDANVAMVTGKASGIVVLDVDPRNGGDKTLRVLVAQHEALPETAETLTGGDGRHVFFRYPGHPIQTRSGALGHGLDVKADGGYIIVPPSIHSSGRNYAWKPSSGLFDVPLAPMPRWMLKRLEVPPQPTGKPADNAHVLSGQRNDYLTSHAGAMRRRGMSQNAILAALVAENSEKCNPSLPDPEVEKIVQSVGRYTAAADATPTSFEPYLVESAMDLVASEIELPKAIIEGVLHKGELAGLVGDSGLGKSWLAQDLAVALVRGDDEWMGRRLCGPVRVLLLHAEGGRSGLWMRLRTILAKRGPFPEEGGLGFWIPGHESLALNDAGNLVRLEATIREGRYELVIPDPLADLSTAPEDNDAYRAITRGLHTITNRTGCAFLINHHVRKRTMMFRSGSGDEVRGGSALRAALDALLLLDRDHDDDTRILLTFSKIRNGPCPPTAVLQRHANGYITYFHDHASRSGRRVTSEELLARLQEIGTNIEQKEFAKQLDVCERTLNGYLRDLSDDAPVRRSTKKRKKFLVYDPQARWKDSK